MNISVAMCTYNGELFLEEQLASLRDQTLQPAELIVCDDGSTDRTPAIVEAFAPTAPFPIHLVRNPTNLGSTGNFEQAIRLCRGEAIALCDQDDRWLPEKLARCAAAFEADPAVAGVFSNALLMDEAGARLPGDLWQRVGFDTAAQQEFLQDAPSYLARRDTVTGTAFAFRTAAIQQLLPLPPEWIHDGWIAFLLASLAKLRFLPEPLLIYRLHHRQQVGATVVPLHTHLSTDGNEALAFHQKHARRFSVLLDRLTHLRSEGAPIAPRVIEEVRTKVAFEQTRAAMLRCPRLARVVPALTLLRSYSRYEKGPLSLLRDLSHRQVAPS